MRMCSNMQITPKRDDLGLTGTDTVWACSWTACVRVTNMHNYMAHLVHSSHTIIGRCLAAAGSHRCSSTFAIHIFILHCFLRNIYFNATV